MQNRYLDIAEEMLAEQGIVAPGSSENPYLDIVDELLEEETASQQPYQGLQPPAANVMPTEQMPPQEGSVLGDTLGATAQDLGYLGRKALAGVTDIGAGAGAMQETLGELASQAVSQLPDALEQEVRNSPQLAPILANEQVGQMIQEKAQLAGEAYNPDQEQQGFVGFGGKVARGAPQAGASLAAFAANPVLGTAYAAGLEGSEGFLHGKDEGAPLDRRLTAGAGRAAIGGVFERIGGRKILEVAGKGSQKELVRVLSDVAQSAVTEGLTEGAQEVNAMLWEWVVDQEMPAEVFNRIKDAALVGGVLGGGMAAGGQVIADRTGQAPAPQEAPVPQEAPAPPPVEQDADVLRVGGPIDLESQDVPVQESGAEIPPPAPEPFGPALLASRDSADAPKPLDAESPGGETLAMAPPKTPMPPKPYDPNPNNPKPPEPRWHSFVDGSIKPPESSFGVTADQAGEARGTRDSNAPVALAMPEIVEFFESWTDPTEPVPITVKKRLQSDGTMGVFNWGKGMIGLRSDLIERFGEDGAAKTVAHEIGHWMDYVLSQPEGKLPPTVDDMGKVWQFLRSESFDNILSKQAQGQAQQVSFVWRPLLEGSPPQFLQYRNDPREIMADVFSAMMNNPSWIEEQAPNLYAETLIAMANVDEGGDLYPAEFGSEAQGAWQAWERLQKQTPGSEGIQERRFERLKQSQREGRLVRNEQIVKATKDRETISAADIRDETIELMIDRNHKVYQDTKRLLGKGANKRLSQKTPDHILRLEEMPYTDSEIAAHGYEIAEQVLPQIEEAGVDIDDLGSILQLQRAKSKDRFMDMGIQGRSAQEVYDHVMKKFGQEKAEKAQGALRRYHNLRVSNVINVMDRSGLLTPDQARQYRGNVNYARRTVETFISDHVNNGMGQGGLPSAFRELVGSLKKSGNYFVETNVSDASLVYLARRNELARDTIDFYRNYGAVRKAKRGEEGKFIGAKKGEELLLFRRDGKLEGWLVPDHVARAVNNDHTGKWSPGPVRLLQEGTRRFFRPLFIDNNPAFHLNNVRRDFFGFATNVVGNKQDSTLKKLSVNPILSLGQSMYWMGKAAPDTWRAVYKRQLSNDIKEMLKQRAILPLNERQYSYLDDDLTGWMKGSDFTEQELLEYIEIQGTSIGAHYSSLDKKHPLWAKLKRLTGHSGKSPFSRKHGEFFEKLTKVAAWKYLKAEGLENYEQAARTTRNLAGTPNIMRRGLAQMVTNNVWLFSNVQKEGWRSAKEAYHRDPASFLGKHIQYSAMTAALTWAASKGALDAIKNLATGEDDDEIKRWFSLVPESTLARYDVIPLGFDQHGRAIGIRSPKDHVGAAVHEGIFEMLEGNENEALSVAFDLIPWSEKNAHPLYKVGKAMSDYREGKNPTDPYWGNSIIRQSDFRAADQEQLLRDNDIETEGTAIDAKRKQMAKWIWNQLGGRVLMKFQNIPENDPETALKQILDLPIAGNVAGAVFFVSDSGLQDELYEAKALESAKTAVPNHATNAFLDSLPVDLTVPEVKQRFLNEGRKVPKQLSKRWKRSQDKRSPDAATRLKATASRKQKAAMDEALRE